MEQLKLSKKKLFGASSEKNTPVDGQINFFNEAETERTPFLPEPKIEEIIVPSHKRKKKSTFEEKYGNIPVKIIETDLSDEEKMCEKCSSEMTFLKWETRHEIEVIPAQVSVTEYKKAVYVCKNCDKNGIEANFKTSETVSALIEKSPVSPSLLSWIMNQKFCLALPLYRQEQELKRMGVMLSRQTMANWMIAGANLLKPLYEKMHEVLLNESILHADETPLEVLNTPDNDKPLNAYMWVYRTGNNSDTSVVLYDYENGRSGDYAKKFLTGFSGYLHCDGLQAYNKVENAKRVGCWAHLRRRFFEALQIQDDKKDYSTIAGQGFLMINRIFHIEGRDPDNPSKKSDYSLEGIARIRKEKSAQMTADFFKWCEEIQGKTLPKSLIGGAIFYALNQKDTLLTFLENPKLELTNNAAERAVKPFVMGRKNWLFCNSPGGANSSAIIYSIIETAKENQLKPYDYLVWLFKKIRSGQSKNIAELLPWDSSIPDYIRMKSDS